MRDVRRRRVSAGRRALRSSLMRATLSYTLLRLLIFFAAAIVLALFGVHGITLIVVALVISAIVSLPLLSKLRDRMSTSLSGRIEGSTPSSTRAPRPRTATDRLSPRDRPVNGDPSAIDPSAIDPSTATRQRSTRQRSTRQRRPVSGRPVSPRSAAGRGLLGQPAARGQHLQHGLHGLRPADRRGVDDKLGISGSSYGSDTPVNWPISPARAFAYRPLRSRASHTSTGVAT